MLKNIPKELTPELFKVLLEMGHGDELVICDGNFPRFAYPDKVVYCMGNSSDKILDLVTQFYPLDNGAEAAIIQMAVNDGDTYNPPTWPKYDQILEKNEDCSIMKKFLNRDEFYNRAKNAYAVIVTGETTWYATIILKKGCVGNG